MSERNVAIARSAIEAFNRGDVDAVLALAAPDVEVYAPPDSPNPGRYVGYEGYLRWSEQWLEAWETFTLDVLDIEAVGDRHVVAVVRQNGRGRLSGLALTMESAHLYEMDEDGKIVRFELHDERKRALENVTPSR
ncbi:MAG: nuclear transport factor 2 family protein [Solirubrobacteraceae bacterium]